MSNRAVQHIGAHKQVGSAKHQGFPYRFPFLFATSYSDREVVEEAESRVVTGNPEFPYDFPIEFASYEDPRTVGDVGTRRSV